jgi:RNA polymerase sigma-70 factor (ECF subfamily)
MARFTVIPGGKSAAERFGSLVGPHYDVVYRTAYRLTRSVHDAEDLVQEVCVRAYPRLDEIAELDNPRAWLLCVLQRLFIDQTRRYERKHVESLETAGEASFVCEAPGLVEQVDQAIRSRRLDHAWQRLTKDQRALLALHDIEGYSLAELMDMTGLKEGTLKSRLHRARVKLGALLKGAEGPAAEADLGAAI